MLSSVVFIERTSGKVIPFEYNYFLAISIYSKLKLYQEEVKPLHQKNQPGIHTISNIISKVAKHSINGLDIAKGFFILRSVDNRIGTYFRLAASIDPNLKIVDSVYRITAIKNANTRLHASNEISFRSLSPILVRNFKDKKLYVADPEEVESNLNLVTKWTLGKQFGLGDEAMDNFSIRVQEVHSKTIRISAGPRNHCITRAFDISGEIRGTPAAIELLYHRGLGSKPGLGLGCWEVV